MKKVFVFLLLSFFSFNIFSNDFRDPCSFLENVLKEIRPYLIEKNDFFLEKTMDKYLAFDDIGVWIVGKTIWNNSSIFEKEKFIFELKKLMLKTYKKTVYYYIDFDIEFLKPKMSASFLEQKRLQVSSVMKKNDKNIIISYRLIKNNDSWLVFDILIEGISILKSLQNQYSGSIKKYGLEYVTEQIRLKNMYDQ